MKLIFSSLLFLALLPSIAVAQITPDSSLGEENSVVKTNGNTATIEGGATRDANLFHSFKDFNVKENREVYFSNSNGITKIFSRVTGNNISKINGVLGVKGNANLYLINPNGIIFGENSKLDVNGSFFATTADSVLFNNGIEFSSSNPDIPPLLTIDIPVGLKFRDRPGDIINRANLVKEERFGKEKIPLIFPLSNQEFSRQEKIVNTLVGLEVKRNQNITFVGGDIILNGGGLSALGGKVQLGGLAKEGTVKIDSNNNLILPENNILSNIRLINDSSIDVRGNSGGDILITGQNIVIKDGSTIYAGIRGFEGSSRSKAGNIVINGVDRVVFDGVRRKNTKRGGANFFTTASNQVGISLEKELIIDGATQFEYIINGKGQGGNIEINTKKLDVTNGARIINVTFGEGNSGHIKIDALESVNLKTPENFANRNSRTQVNSIIENKIFATKEVKTGKIAINTPLLNLSNRSKILALIFKGEGGGQTGDIEINTQSLNLVDNGLIGQQINLRILNLGEISNLGDVIINAEKQILIEGNNSQIINAFTTQEKGLSKGVSNTGDIRITTQKILLSNGAEINNRTEGKGTLGDIDISAEKQIILDSTDNNQSAIFNIINQGGDAKAGDIKIATQHLKLINGSLISETISNGGKGDLGEIIINANNIFIEGKTDRSKIGFFPESSIYSNIENNAEGDGGTIRINTQNLSLINKGQLFTSTFGKGNAGHVVIKAQDINISGGNIKSEVDIIDGQRGEGDGGTININTNNLKLSNEGSITVSSKANGNTGQILVNANFIELRDRSVITAETNFKDFNSDVFLKKAIENNIFINIDGNLIFKNNSLISAKATEQANGGNIEIRANNIIAFPNNNDIIASAQRGNGGRIKIQAESIFGINKGSSNPPNLTNDIDASSKLGLSGQVTIEQLKVEPIGNFLDLTPEIVDASQLITQNICQQTTNSEFINIGKGGLPENPHEILAGDNIQIGLVPTVVTLEELSIDREEKRETSAKITPKETRKPPAQGLILHQDGLVELVAHNPHQLSEQRNWNHPHSCQ